MFILQIMLDDSVEILYPDGSISRCSVFQVQSNDDDATLEPSILPKKLKGEIMTSLPDDVDDQVDESMKLSAQWMTVTCDGQRFLQNDGGSQCLGNYVKQSLATCPDTRQVIMFSTVPRTLIGGGVYIHILKFGRLVSFECELLNSLGGLLSKEISSHI